MSSHGLANLGSVTRKGFTTRTAGLMGRQGSPHEAPSAPDQSPPSHIQPQKAEAEQKRVGSSRVGAQPYRAGGDSMWLGQWTQESADLGSPEGTGFRGQVKGRNGVAAAATRHQSGGGMGGALGRRDPEVSAT